MLTVGGKELAPEIADERLAAWSPGVYNLFVVCSCATQVVYE